MEIIVGVNQDASSSDALAMGSSIANTLGADLVVVNVYPKAWDFVGPAHVDAEWRSFLVEQGNETLQWAREELDGREGVTYVLHPHRSSGVGLAEVATSRNAQMILIGSAPGGSSGRIHGGSTSDQLFHGSPVPVGIAPQGYVKWAPQVINRAVVAYQPTKQSDHCIDVTLRSLAKA
ncbi:MAG: universal stress protein, partial [Actinobacteria bacterium]|nr:universal stress protein [Actinomycetota bacterium]